MNNCFVILAAGKSKRFGQNLPKQFYKYKNKEIIDHSVEISLNSKLFNFLLPALPGSAKLIFVSKKSIRWMHDSFGYAPSAKCMNCT